MFEKQVDAMTITSFYPLLTVTNLDAALRFYTTHLPFEATFVSDWYISLRTTGAVPFELAFIEPGHASVPDGWRHATAAGVILTMEVEDVDAVHAAMQAAGLPMHVPLRDEPHGQRHFITEDPNGVLLDVITPIPPAEGFAEGYVEAIT
ncbi:MAG: VOC family protein [Bacteroidota bacterium]